VNVEGSARAATRRGEVHDYKKLTGSLVSARNVAFTRTADQIE
jgi:hypothetical protein